MTLFPCTTNNPPTHSASDEKIAYPIQAHTPFLMLNTTAIFIRPLIVDFYGCLLIRVSINFEITRLKFDLRNILQEMRLLIGECKIYRPRRWCTVAVLMGCDDKGGGGGAVICNNGCAVRLNCSGCWLAISPKPLKAQPNYAPYIRTEQGITI